MKCVQDLVGFGSRCKNHKSALASQIERLETEHGTYSSYSVLNRNLIRVKRYTYVALCSYFIENGSYTASCSISDNMNILCSVKYCLYIFRKRCTVAGDIRIDLEIISRKKDRTSVAADITCYDDLVSRLCKCARCGCAIDYMTDSGCCNENLIYLSFAGNLGISSNKIYSRFSCGLAHSLGNLLKLIYRESLFNYERACEIFRLCAHACYVIDCSAD